MSITVQAPSTPGFHVFDTTGAIVFSAPVRGNAINHAVDAGHPGVINATGALIWGTRNPGSGIAAAPKAPKAGPKPKAPRAPRTRPAASGNPTPGGNGCSKGRLQKWAAKYGAEVETGADAVVVTALEGLWVAGDSAGHIVVRWADHSNARAAYGAALAAVKQGLVA